MKPTHVYWFTAMSGTIGLVVGEDNITKEKKAYISAVPGYNEKEDTKIVMERGSPVSLGVLLEITDSLKPTPQGSV